MDAPAICGTQLVVDLFEGNIHFDVATLIEYVEMASARSTNMSGS